MTDKAIEIAKAIRDKVWNYPDDPVQIMADIIRPYLAPETPPRKPYAAIGISVGEAKK
jgi:hypothetical protein